MKWVWNEEDNTWECPSCDFKWDELGLFDGEYLDPYDFDCSYCPRCGEHHGESS